MFPCRALVAGASAARVVPQPSATGPIPSRMPSASGASLRYGFIGNPFWRVMEREVRRAIRSSAAQTTRPCYYLPFRSPERRELARRADDPRLRFQDDVEACAHAVAHALRQAPELVARSAAMIHQHQCMAVRNAGISIAQAFESTGVNQPSRRQLRAAARRPAGQLRMFAA